VGEIEVKRETPLRIFADCIDTFEEQEDNKINNESNKMGVKYLGIRETIGYS
jgi:hypothetical protein